MNRIKKGIIVFGVLALMSCDKGGGDVYDAMTAAADSIVAEAFERLIADSAFALTVAEAIADSARIDTVFYVESRTDTVLFITSSHDTLSYVDTVLVLTTHHDTLFDIDTLVVWYTPDRAVIPEHERMDMRVDVGLQLRHNLAQTRVASDSLIDYLIGRRVDLHELGGAMWLGGNDRDYPSDSLGAVRLDRMRVIGWYEFIGDGSGLLWSRDFFYVPERDSLFYHFPDRDTTGWVHPGAE